MSGGRECSLRHSVQKTQNQTQSKLQKNIYYVPSKEKVKYIYITVCIRVGHHMCEKTHKMFIGDTWGHLCCNISLYLSYECYILMSR